MSSISERPAIYVSADDVPGMLEEIESHEPQATELYRAAGRGVLSLARIGRSAPSLFTCLPPIGKAVRPLVSILVDEGSGPEGWAEGYATLAWAQRVLIRETPAAELYARAVALACGLERIALVECTPATAWAWRDALVHAVTGRA